MKLKPIASLIFLIAAITCCLGQTRLYYDLTGNGVNDSAHANYYRIGSFDASGKSIDSVHDYYTTGEIRLKGKALCISKDTDSQSKWIGRRIIYYKNGNIEADDNFNKKGEMDSISTRYFESGKMRQLINCKNGAVVDKFFKEWDEFGNSQKVFNDMFHYSNNKNNWPLNVNEKHDCHIIKDTGLIMATFGANGVLQAIELPLENEKKYSIESVVEFESGSPNSWHGLVWGFKDWDNYYFFLINAAGYYRIGSVYEGIVKYNPNEQQNNNINTGKAKNLMQILTQKGRTVFSVNGKVVCSTVAYRFTGNHIGFLIPGEAQKVLFRNISVKQSISDDNTYDTPGAGDPNTTNEFNGWKGSGTGFFIDASGYIVTNYHVIKGATEIEIDQTINGQKSYYKVIVVSSDPQNDMALLKITDKNFKPLESLPYNFKADISDVGSSVFALGYPVPNVLGAEIKFTDGKISSKTGFNGSPEEYQISVPIQPGNSGGPLFDNDGNIIGITNASVRAGQNVNYAIKSGYLKNFLEAVTDKLNLPSDPSIANKELTEKIKILSNYVVLIKVK